MVFKQFEHLAIGTLFKWRFRRMAETVGVSVLQREMLRHFNINGFLGFQKELRATQAVLKLRGEFGAAKELPLG